MNLLAPRCLPPTPIQSGSLTTTCFSVAYIGCDTSRACCRGMLAAVDKLSFETTAACGVKSNIAGVTVNGKSWPSWNPYSHPSGKQQQQQTRAAWGISRQSY